MLSPFAFRDVRLPRLGSQRAAGGGGGAAPPPVSRVALFIDADIDFTGGGLGERDDFSAMALWLAEQDLFNIVGLTASAPDSNASAYEEIIAAYETDFATLSANMPDASVMKTPTQLRGFVTQGSIVDAPARGYWIPGDGAGYNAPHAAAQKLIAAALANGNPAGGPAGKLWLMIQGGFTTISQAAHEAVTLGDCPDFFDRVRVVAQPNFNSGRTPNAWAYLFGNAWPSAGTPGIFGNLWMKCGYLQWHAFNRDNLGSDAQFWNSTTSSSAMGAALNSSRDGAYPTAHWRAGDAGAWFWLRNAVVQNNFDPTNANNPCGIYQTYPGVNPWPSRTFGYGTLVRPEAPNPEGLTFSNTIWAPALTVNTFEASYRAASLSDWYYQVGQTMQRYGAPATPISALTSLLYPFTDGSGQVLTDFSGNVRNARLGTTTGIDVTDPAWSAQGLVYSAGDVVSIAGGNLRTTAFHALMAVNLSSLAADANLLTLDGATRGWLLQVSTGGLLRYVTRGGGGPTHTAIGGVVGVGNWAMIEFAVTGLRYKAWLNGALVMDGVSTELAAIANTNRVIIGARLEAGTGSMLGTYGWLAYCHQELSGQVQTDLRQACRDAMSAKGVTLP